jgi:translation initiation factor IF-1
MAYKETTKGIIIDCLPNANFKVELENKEIVRAYTGGKIRMNRIQILLGDKVELAVPEYGEIYRIIYRK